MSEDLQADQYHVLAIQVKGFKTKQEIQDYVTDVEAVLQTHGAEIQRKTRVLLPSAE
jgi:hypothetical protein